ncbi:hypothetical protein [Mycobacterium asiaticum]|uniref:hypothetical protein n=1 Tax=Mycobacterium asiaticum TaxID=1790 RepID=UPI0005618D52|nr:hypothetical protein [Mycobacterium asiaticum]
MHELVQDERRQIVEQVRIVDEDTRRSGCVPSVNASATLRAKTNGALSASSVHCEKAPSGIGRLVVVAATLRTVQPAAAVAVTTSRANRDLPTPAPPANATPGRHYRRSTV